MPYSCGAWPQHGTKKPPRKEGRLACFAHISDCAVPVVSQSACLQAIALARKASLGNALAGLVSASSAFRRGREPSLNATTTPPLVRSTLLQRETPKRARRPAITSLSSNPRRATKPRTRAQGWAPTRALKTGNRRRGASTVGRLALMTPLRQASDTAARTQTKTAIETRAPSE